MRFPSQGKEIKRSSSQEMANMAINLRNGIIKDFLKDEKYGIYVILP